MSKSRMLSELKAALKSKRLARLRRRFEDCSIKGYVQAVGPEFVLLALVCDRMYFDGFACFRIKDITQCEPNPYVRFVETALRKRKQKKPKKGRLSVDSLEKLLSSANRAFPLITIHLEETKPDVCYIGRIIDLNSEQLTLLEIDPDAEWDYKPEVFSLREITQVNFGGGYEDALYLVGGEPRLK